MSADESKATVRRFFEVISQGDEAALDELVAPDAEIVGALGGGRGPAVYKRVFATLRSAFPDVRFTVEDMVAEGDRVAVRMTTSGTHRGPFMGIAPTGRSMRWSGAGILDVRDGRIVRQWAMQDRLAFFEQAGAAPTWERLPTAAP